MTTYPIYSSRMTIPTKALPKNPPKFSLDQTVSFPANFICDWKHTEEETATGEIMMIDVQVFGRGRELQWKYGIAVEGCDDLIMVTEWVLL